MKLFKVFISAILAGILIGVGGIVYVAYSTTSAFVAALLFSFGLFTIIMTGVHLYTGKVGYVFEQKPSYIGELLIIFVGNIIGSGLMGILIHFTRFSDKYKEVIKGICDTKLNDNLLSIFILSILCGIMIYLAVDVSKKLTSGFQKTFAISIPVIIFILSGFEHVIANVFYFAASFTFTSKMLLYILIMAVGNALGSIAIWGLQKLIANNNKTTSNESDN